MPTKRKTSQQTATRNLLRQLCQVLEDKKAEDVVVLDVGKQSSITNFLVLATGTSEPHLRALRGELDRVISETDTRVVGIDEGAGSGWTVVDAFDVMVHIFTPETRARYRLENLWGDSAALNVAQILAPRAVRKKKVAS